ncbi:hypothetical protein L7F22_008113 [Adiantum nelumboides]|nr:hypothetical protein [Adiantum nelumboides]
MGDLYSGYDQFQLSIESRDLTTMKTPLGLVRMCTLPQGATNSVAHMMNGMNKLLRDFIPQVTMPFIDDFPIKGCEEGKKEETLDAKGCRRFVADHINDCDKILSRLEKVNLTLSGKKSMFGVNEVLIVGHMCGPYGRKPSPTKVDAIQRIKDTCTNVTEVRRFLGACVFYVIWIPHYAHVADPLYQLLRKNQRSKWGDAHVKAMKKLKVLLQSAPTLRKVNYECERPVIITVDTSPTGIGWAIGQDDEEGHRYVVRFGAKVLSVRQRNYPQVKRELWGLVTSLKCDKDYLIGAYVVVETDCLPILGMIASCSTPHIAMLRWIAYIKSLNPEFKHIAGKDNPVADMLSRARYEDEEGMIDESDDVGTKFYSIAHAKHDHACISNSFESFLEEMISILYLVRDIDSVTVTGFLDCYWLRLETEITGSRSVTGLDSGSEFLFCIWISILYLVRDIDSVTVTGFLDCYWLVSGFLDCDWTGYWLVSGFWLISVTGFWLIFVTGSGPSAGTQGSAIQDPHIAASDSSSDFDVMEGYPMQQHPESSSQDMHALGQQPGISMFSRLKENLSKATRSEHATNEINEGGGEVDSPFTSQIDPVLSESVHVSIPATTPIGLSKLTPSETLLPDGKSLAEVQEVERYILAAREKEIKSLRKAKQRRVTLAKAPMTSANTLQSPELTTLKSQPIGSHIASGSKDTSNTSILDGVFLNETEKLTDLYTSYTYHVGWLNVIQATSNSTSVDEQQRMICDVIHSIVQMERQNLGINMPSMGPMRFLDTTKAKQPTISQMETPSVSPMDPSYIVSPGVSMQSEPTHGSFSFPDLVQPSLGDLPTPTMNMTGGAPSTSLVGTTPLHTSVAPLPIPIGVHQPYVPVATHPYVASMPPPNPTAYVPQSHYPSPYFSGAVPAGINTSYPTSAIPEPTSTSFRPSLGAVPYEVWDPRRVRMPRPKPANPFPYVVPRVPAPVASTPIMPTHLGYLAAFAQTIGRSIVENMHNLPDREPRSKAVQVAKIAQKYNGDGDVRKHVEIFEQWDHIEQLTREKNLDELEWLIRLLTTSDPYPIEDMHPIAQIYPLAQVDYTRLVRFLVLLCEEDDEDIEDDWTDMSHGMTDNDFIYLDDENRGLALGLPPNLYNILFS